ncbi:alpha/beta hydrolase [Clostridium sp. JN-1]|jgi:alpha-beta hydrolase superfamily lysophospholipase|uniref:alpha/beta hydrolase family protein n=1 Tax=Clostridium sp. JN-1 TaxID=2483110 RepID=UPI000F0B6B45|nr:alpha/beta hydrolase [Clostridium sp. JN-1]
MKHFFKNKQFSFQTMRLLGATAWGAADIGEVLSTAGEIKDGNTESWCAEWTQTAKRLDNFANLCYFSNSFISASESYLRASNYYRTAGFYLHEDHDNSKYLNLYSESLRCFSNVVKLSNLVIEPVKIPYEDIELPGYFYHAKKTKDPSPTIITLNSLDGTKEEMYGFAMSAVKRGMNCLTFDGPGQGEVIIKHHLVFRHDYEKVITPIVDYLISREEVDKSSIIILGESLGGYLAPRAAAFEHRLKACIANSGIFDLLGDHIPKNLPRKKVFEEAENNMDKYNTELNKIMDNDTNVRWFILHGMYVFGAKSPIELILKCQHYFLKDISNKIQCPTLVTESEGDSTFSSNQAKSLYNSLICPKEFMLFTKEEGVNEHCQAGSKLIASERIFNWIEKML